MPLDLETLLHLRKERDEWRVDDGKLAPHLRAIKIHGDDINFARIHACDWAPESEIRDAIRTDSEIETLRLVMEDLVALQREQIAIQRDLIEKVDRIHRDQNDDREYGQIRDTRLEDRLRAIEGGRRKDCKLVDQRRHKLVVIHFYDGLCPCCESQKIIEGDSPEECTIFSLEFDHWFSPSKNGVDEMWPVCRLCNKRLHEETSFKVSQTKKFFLYQAKREWCEKDPKTRWL